MFFRMVYKSGQIFLPFSHNARVWRTGRRTEFSSLYRVCITCSAVKTGKIADKTLGRAHCIYLTKTSTSELLPLISTTG